MICKSVAILSRSQFVKHRIDLELPLESCIHQMDMRAIVWKTHQKKLRFATRVIIAIIQTRCIHGNNTCSRPICWLGCLKRHFSMKHDILRNIYKMLQSLTKILFNLVWLQCEILVHITFWQKVHWSGIYQLPEIVPRCQRTFVKYLVCHCTENRESSWRRLCHFRGRCRLPL